jgi:hypothetical protein
MKKGKREKDRRKQEKKESSDNKINWKIKADSNIKVTVFTVSQLYAYKLEYLGQLGSHHQFVYTEHKKGIFTAAITGLRSEMYCKKTM